MGKRNNKKKNTLVLLLLLLVGIGIGYAALTSNLNINGNTNIKKAEWDVYWNNVQITDGSVNGENVTQAATITDEARTQVDYSITLNKPGDFYEFTVDAVNAGTIDAMIATDGIKNHIFESDGTTPAILPKVISYKVTYADGKDIEANHLLAKKQGDTPTTETYKVRIQYRNDDEINPSDLEEVTATTIYTFKFSVEYVQAENAKDRTASAVTILKGTKGNLQPGDQIKIGDAEEFYVISSDATNTVLLAKYNLLVGNIAKDSSVAIGEIPASTQGYGLQSSEAIGYISGTGTYKGTIAFSTTSYWHDYSTYTLKSPYNENGANYSGNPYPYVYDSNSNIYSIVNTYVNTLKTAGAPESITGRLLSYEEADSIKNVEDNGTSIIFGNKQSYWLGSATNYRNNINLWKVDYNYNDFFSQTTCNIADGYGVRPVIIIPTSEI